MDGIGSTLSNGLSGLQRASQQLNQSSARIAQGEIEVEPIVDAKVAEAGFKANAQVIKAADELTETALDLLA